MSEEVIDFDLEPRIWPFKVGGKDYVVKEASDGIVRRYRNAITTNVTMVDGKVSGIGNAADSDAILLRGCVFKVVDGKHYTINDIESWPQSVTKKLLAKAKELSEIGEGKEDPDKLKKSQTIGQEGLDSVQLLGDSSTS